jgi:hypothetical protein
MPRFRRPSEYAHDARTLKQIGNSLGIDLKEVFAAADKVKQLAPPATPATPIPDNQPAVPAFSTPAPVVEPEPAPLLPPLGVTTGLWGQQEPIPAEQPDLRPDVGNVQGSLKASPHPLTPKGAKWYQDYCSVCNSRMWTRAKLEDVCEECLFRLYDDYHETRVRTEVRAGGRLVNPFGGDE